MRISQVKREIINLVERKQKKSDIISSFVVYDSVFKKILTKPVFINKIIIPFCFRQMYFSHMCVAVVSSEKIFYFDPSNEPLPSLLVDEFFSEFFSDKKIIQIYNNYKNTQFECTLFCLDFLNNIIQNDD